MKFSLEGKIVDTDKAMLFGTIAPTVDDDDDDPVQTDLYMTPDDFFFQVECSTDDDTHTMRAAKLDEEDIRNMIEYSSIQICDDKAFDAFRKILREKAAE